MKKGGFIAIIVFLVLGVVAGFFVVNRFFVPDVLPGQREVAGEEAGIEAQDEAGLVWVSEPYFEADSMRPFLPNYFENGSNPTYENSLHLMLDPRRVDASRIGELTLYTRNGVDGIINYIGTSREADKEFGFTWLLIEEKDLDSSTIIKSKNFGHILDSVGSYIFVPAEHSYLLPSEGPQSSVYTWLDDSLQPSGEVQQDYFDDALFDRFAWDTDTEEWLHYSTSIHDGFWSRGTLTVTDYPFPATEIKYVDQGDYVEPIYTYDKYGYVQNGEVVLPFVYSHAGRFNDGVAAVKKNNEAFYIDTQGNRITTEIYNYINEVNWK